MTREENLCEHCPGDIKGACCHYEEWIHGVRVVIDHHCKFLDTMTCKCRIYKFRKLLKPWSCLSVKQMIEQGTVPKNCPYVVDNVEYQERDDTRQYYFELKVHEIERCFFCGELKPVYKKDHQFHDIHGSPSYTGNICKECHDNDMEADDFR